MTIIFLTCGRTLEHHTNSLATGFDEGGSNLFRVVARLLELRYTMSNFCVLEKL